MCAQYHLEKKDKWCEHAPDKVSENDEVKLLWDVNIKCDHVIKARKPDIVVVNKQQRKCTIIDIAVPAHKRIGEKENEKVEKYHDLRREIARMWNTRTVEGGINYCRIIEKCNKKLEQLVGKSGCQNCYSITAENYGF